MVKRVPIRMLFKTLFQPVSRQTLEFGFQSHAFRKFIDREIVVGKVHFHAAFFRNAHGIGQSLGHMAKILFHLFGRFIIKIARLKTHSLGIVDLCLGLDAQEYVMGFHIVRIQIMAVVGRHQGRFGMFGQFQQLRIQKRLVGEGVRLNFKVKTIPENAPVFMGQGNGLIKRAAPLQQTVVSKQGPGNFSCQTCGQGDKAIAVFAQQFLVHSRLVVKAVQKTTRDEAYKIMVAFIIFGQQDQMVPDPRPFRIFIRMIMRDVYFAAYDGFQPIAFAGRVEIGRPVEVAVVGDGGRRHTEILGPGAQIVKADGSVKQAVFRMTMQMHEFGHKAPTEKSFFVSSTRSAFAPQSGPGQWNRPTPLASRLVQA